MQQGWRQGRARGLYPRRKVKTIFSEIFGIYSTLKTIFVAPSSEESAPHWKIPGATPDMRYIRFVV